MDIWRKFSVVRSQISQECRQKSRSAVPVKSNVCLNDAVDAGVNEWRLFHGTSHSRALSICNGSFRMSCVGTGATWRDDGQESGMPLYGCGCYFAERITKADEYTGQEGPDLQVVLVCRVIGGHVNRITTNEIEVSKLKSDVFTGPYHSVLGDRESVLGKPFRE